MGSGSAVHLSHIRPIPSRKPRVLILYFPAALQAMFNRLRTMAGICPFEAERALNVEAHANLPNLFCKSFSAERF
jgi:hypothetical protein